MNAILIEGRALTLSFGKERVLDNVYISIRTAEMITLIGPNGAGKSILVKTLLGLQKPDYGQIIRKKDLKVGYVPQKIEIDKIVPLTVYRFLTLTIPASRSDCKYFLEKVKADHILDRQMSYLSGGETQRVMLARAIMLHPELLVLDEPTQGVDISGQIELYRLINSIPSELNCAVLMISHDFHRVLEQPNPNQVVFFNRHICCAGELDNLYQHSECEYRSRFTE